MSLNWAAKLQEKPITKRPEKTNIGKATALFLNLNESSYLCYKNPFFYKSVKYWTKNK